MKKILCFVLTMLLSFCAVLSTFAQEPIEVFIDGQRVQFDVQPHIINDRTMVPLRAIFESLGASVGWDSATRTVTSTRGNTTISFTIDSSTMHVNNESVILDSPACIVDGRTFVPVRAISEAFGIEVQWEKFTQAILLSTTGENVEPDVAMYAADGRTQTVPLSQVEANLSVGSYLEPMAIMYAPDGRTEVVCESEISAWQNVGWYTTPVVTVYAADGRTLLIPESEVDTYINQGWNPSPVLSKDDFLSMANGWWIDLDSCRSLSWANAYALEYIRFSSDKIEVGSTYSEFCNYQLKQLKFVGNNTYIASIYMPGFWYADEYYSPENFNWTITYNDQGSLSWSFDGAEWYTYTFIGTNHDYDSIQRHPYVIRAAK